MKAIIIDKITENNRFREILKYPISNTENIILAYELSELSMLQELMYSTHYENEGNKYFGHYNMSFSDALRDFAMRIDEKH